MPFCSVQSFEHRGLSTELRQLIGDRETGALDMAIFLQAAADADALINPALASQPANARQDPLLEGLAFALTRYRLFPDHAPERVKDDNDAALAKLRQIQQGEISLGVQEAPIAANTGGVLVQAPPRVFNETGFEGY